MTLTQQPPSSIRPRRSSLARLLLVALALAACQGDPPYPPDDAKAAGKVPADFPQTSTDLLKDMDGGIALDGDETKGRNSWILWTAGNQVFWDRLSRQGYGLVDLIKTLDSRQRSRRFAEMGLINEPGFRQADRPDRLGLWLDEPIGPAPPGIDEAIYGRSSGVIGFRIYPNPDFDEQARARWDAERYHNDPGYYTDPSLIRPYRVGVTCGSCHVGPNPLNPPADPENPKWENLSSAIGNQYIREGKVFTRAEPGSFFWEMLNAQPPGTSDTSRAATDHINNPSAINTVVLLDARLRIAAEETIAGGALAFAPGTPRKVPHFLKDGADSVGPAAAMLRVYLNEGLYSQQWLADHDLLLGRDKQRPFSAANAFRNSVYWQATHERIPGIVKFFMRLKPARLEDAPGGRARITSDPVAMVRGKTVFAENCAGCHSGKQPPGDIDARSPEGLQWFREAVMRADFRNDNFLSTERRIRVTDVKTNACRALATNATRGHIWDNFSSETYKSLPSVGAVESYDPADEARPHRFQAPAGGPGYYRVPSLAGLWSSAPFLHNNSLGIFTGDPSVAGRMRAFDDAVEKLLWPERRLGIGSIQRTSRDSFITIPKPFVPPALRPLAKGDALRIGPVPKGTPINLLANLDPTLPDAVKLIAAVDALLLELARTGRDASQPVAAPADSAVVRRLVSTLMSASTCPDLVEDRGHEYGSRLPDSDKRALIEFLKTL